MDRKYNKSFKVSACSRGAVVVGLSLVFALAETFVSPAYAESSSSIEDGVYTITSSLSGRDLDISGANTSNGGNVQTYDGNGTFAQYWRVEKVGEHYSIKNSLTGVSLDVANGSASSGANVQVFSSNGTKAQLWDLIENPDGTITIQSALKEGLVLDVQWATKANGTNVQVYNSNSSAAQKWTLTKLDKAVDNGTFSIKSSINNSKALDVQNGSLENGAAVQLYDSNGTLAQKWGLKYDPKTGFYTISAAISGKSIDIPGANSASGVALQQYSSNGTAAQAWRIVTNDDGSYSIFSALSGCVLDVKGANAYNGAKVQVYSPNGTKAQKWAIEGTSLNLSGIYQLSSAADSSAVIDVSSASTSPDAKIQVWSDNGALAQKWKIAQQSDGFYAIKNANSGLYLRDSGQSLVGSNAIDASSEWEALVGNGGLTFVNVQTGKALDLSGCNTSAGTRVGTYASNGTKAQAWVLKSTGIVSEGCYTLYNRSGKNQVLDVPSGSMNSGVLLQTYESNGTGAQKWNVKSAGNGWYSISNAASGKALDVQNGSAFSGAGVWQYDSNGSNAQLWKFDVAPAGGVMVVSRLGDYALSTKSSSVTNGTGIDIESYSSDSNATFSWTFSPTNYVAASSQSVSYVKVKKVPSDYSTLYVHMKDGSVKSYEVWCGANTFTGTFSVKHTAYALDKNPTTIGGQSYDSRDINGWWVCYVEDWKSIPDDPNRSRQGCDQGTHQNEYDEGQGFHYGLPGGSRGCILFPSKSDAAEFYELMKQNIGATIQID